MSEIVNAINIAYRQDKTGMFEYGILTAMMKTVTEGLTKQNEEIEKELDKIMSEGVLKIPGEEYCLRVKDQYISEGIKIGIVRGMIDAYYNDMRLSPEEIAKKMDKPLEEVQEIIQSLSDES